MLSTILSWIYIFLICTLIGVGVLNLFEKRNFSLSGYLMAGIIVISVYVEIFSIFMNIGACAQVILLLAALLIGYKNRNRMKWLWKRYRPVIFSWEGFFYACFILGIAFFTSRGEFHTDTNIYHAAAIRIYEEYGLVKGIGNLQLHYAYNSSYLAFASIFSLRWLLGYSLHTTTGFLETFMCLYAFRGLKNFKQHKNYVTDMMRIGILLYTLINVTRSMSPATDYAAMYFALFIITAWCENLFESHSDVTVYALLSLAAAFTVTLKFSSCLLVVLVVYPVYRFVREKRWREIFAYIFCGCIVIFPFLIRNYFISGWLLYPFDGIDIFQTVWKIPKEYLLHDARQIKVWGRCLYDVDKIDMPVKQWLPVWWENQFRYEQMFLGAVIISSILQLVMLLNRILQKQRLRIEFIVLHMAIWGNIIMWFFIAPFIRYALAFLIAVIMIAMGEYLSEKKRGLYSIVTGCLAFCVFVAVSPYWNQYVTDAGVFVKQGLKDPYYIRQKDYDEGSMDSCVINGNVIYFSTGEEINSYHVFPGTCYKPMLERSTLIGDRIEDGFCAK
ncbi:MAG: hypothetical protein NC118_06390 [Eubacterium sp.]|nr:hypothetical protein [Butyrivibrio sp.]MCM1426217.1 hypothetical protein [Eubacterium sp.]